MVYASYLLADNLCIPTEVTVAALVEVQMLPHGAMRGLAEDIDDSGRLVLASPTGLRERIAVSSLNNVTLLEE